MLFQTSTPTTPTKHPEHGVFHQILGVLVLEKAAQHMEHRR